jgi:hypothetical protein
MANLLLSSSNMAAMTSHANEELLWNHRILSMMLCKFASLRFSAGSNVHWKTLCTTFIVKWINKNQSAITWSLARPCLTAVIRWTRFTERKVLCSSQLSWDLPGGMFGWKLRYLSKDIELEDLLRWFTQLYARQFCGFIDVFRNRAHLIAEIGPCDLSTVKTWESLHSKQLM